ncbi:disease resistance protein RGA5-like [Phragmites australis]|uniref:disease resistance protein RGA5-like n=1 Tax=Phragmites australis TaxID=29695 RepID=UPI002D77316A|nr:disease resistance protein RGA5-like [Phragmites australis]
MDLMTGAMGILPSKLLELLKEEYKLQKGVRAEVKSLSRELESIHAALRKVVAVPWDQLDEQVKVWAREVREASYDLEDVLDTFLVRIEGREPADPSRLKRAMKKMGDLFSKVKARHDIADAIEDIKKQLQEVAERRARYKVDDLVARPATAASVDPRISALYTKASVLVGIDERRDALIEMLSVGEDDRSDKEMKIISIVGFGGLGKTTLAKAVYDKVQPQFDCSAFVPVGRNPDPRKVLRDILIDLIDNKTANTIIDHDKKKYTGVDLMELDERQLINKLREFLEVKRYFIVVDDIWETSIWGMINNAFVDSNCGGRIIATTRNSQVSMEIGEEVYRLEELSDTNSKKLFYTKIFGGEEKRPYSDELDEVSGKIIQKCGGVPLAIITIASVLATKPIKDWSMVYNSIGFGHSDNTQVKDTMKILSFSYYDLPCYLRTCLLYLSVFPEDHTIGKSGLILRWIAEGLVHEEKGKDIFEVGDSYFNELINRSLVIPIEEKGSGLLFGCRVHDMVLHLIRDLSSEENFVVVLDSEQLSLAQGNARRLALQLLNFETFKKLVNLSVEHSPQKVNYKAMPQVRSFNALLCVPNIIPPVCSFQVLRVLVLEYCFGMEDYPLEHIAKLLHLRYFGLSHTPTRKLPKEIGRLRFLQTLLLDDTGIKELPASVRLLTQLICLRVDEKTRVPDWIGELTSLVELEMCHGADNKCSTRWFVKELGNLTNLRVLKTGINLQHEEQGRDLLESLRNLHKIHAIAISFPEAFLQMDVVMEPSFALSSSLSVLILLNMKFSRLPAWINAQDLPNLCQLKVVVSDVEEQDLGILGMFRELRELGLLIIRVRRLKLTVCGRGGFENLRFFDVTVPLQFVQGAMPRLEYINFSIPVIELNDANIGLDFGLENLSSLQSVKASIDCVDACPTEVEEAEAALRHAVDIHPNHPTLEARRIYEEKMGPVDADSRMTSRRNYKILQAYNAYALTPEMIEELEEHEKAAMDNQTNQSVLGTSTQDYLISNKGDKVPISELQGKYVGLYFVVNGYGPVDEFTAVLAKIYEKLKEVGEQFEVVAVSLDKDESSFNESFAKMPWLAIPQGDKMCEKLVRYFFELNVLPTLVLIGPDGKILNNNVADIIQEHGLEAWEGFPFSAEKLEILAEKAKAKAAAQTLESLLVSGDLNYVIGKDGAKVPVSELVGKTVLLYFSAKWCGPCRAFLPTLVKEYNKIKEKNSEFAIIFISSDRDQSSFDEFFSDMPWLALPLEDERKEFLKKNFKVRGIPSLVAIGPTGQTVSKDAKGQLVIYGADAFPFTEERLEELQKKLDKIAKRWPGKLKHELHKEHELVLMRHGTYGCDGCKEIGNTWSYRCDECDFDLHPKCALFQLILNLNINS